MRPRGLVLACGLAACTPAPAPTSPAPPLPSASVPRAAASDEGPRWAAASASSRVVEPLPPPPASSAARQPSLAAPACRGGALDLDALLANPKCHAPAGMRPGTSTGVEDVSVMLTVSPDTVAPGKTAEAELTLTNRTDAEVTLWFEVGCTSEISTRVLDARGERVDLVTPPLAMLCMSRPLLVGLMPHGVARARHKVRAGKVRIDASDREHPAGPLARGTYELVMDTRLMGPRLADGSHPTVSAKTPWHVK